MSERDRHHPETTGSALLDIAQRALIEGLLPHLNVEQRTLARMVASAMRMTAREIEQERALAASTREIAAMLSSATENGTHDVPDREHVLAVRQGRFDADPRLHALLWADAAVRASVAKPSSLSRIERRLAGLPDADDAVG